MSLASTETVIPNLPHLGVCTALLAGELPAADQKEGAAQWIKVTPRGPAQTRDGRRFSFTPETLVARYKSDGIDLPADLNHALALKATKGDKADAIGWAKELQARPDGTYARMDWLDGGKAVLAARTHRYVSPTFHHDEAGEATWLHSIALLAAPALAMPALAAAAGVQTSAKPPATIAEALGLDASADDAACLAAIIARGNDYVPVTLFVDTLAALNAANASLASQRSEARQKRVVDLIEGALMARKIVPAQRGQYEALCQTDAGLAQVAMLFANTIPALAASGLDARRPDNGEAERPEALAVRAGRYREAQAVAGIALTQAEAIRFAHENPDAGL